MKKTIASPNPRGFKPRRLISSQPPPMGMYRSPALRQSSSSGRNPRGRIRARPRRPITTVMVSHGRTKVPPRRPGGETNERVANSPANGCPRMTRRRRDERESGAIIRRTSGTRTSGASKSRWAMRPSGTSSGMKSQTTPPKSALRSGRRSKDWEIIVQYSLRVNYISYVTYVIFGQWLKTNGSGADGTTAVNYSTVRQRTDTV